MRFAPHIYRAVLALGLFAQVAQATCEDDLVKPCPNCGYELLCNEANRSRVPYDQPEIRSCLMKTASSADMYFRIERENTKRSEVAARAVEDCVRDSERGPVQPSSVQVVGEANFHTMMSNRNDMSLPLGGLSGLAADPGKQKLIAVTDDRMYSGLVEISWELKPGETERPIRFKMGPRTPLTQEVETRVQHHQVVVPPPANESFFKSLGRLFSGPEMKTVTIQTSHTKAVDREDIVVLPDGRLVVSGELGEWASGQGQGGEDKAPSFLSIFSRSGHMVDDLKAPVAFLKKGYQPSGLDYNRGIEAMTIVPGTDTLIFANEGPLLQDNPKPRGFNGPRATATRGFVRIYSGSAREMEKTPPERFVKYELDGLESGGLVALAALDDTRVLALERGFDKAKREAIVRLYFVTLSQQDSSGTVEKRLIADFNDLRDQFAAGFRKIDNFEGLALGPVLDGKQVVFTVSDNNFSKVQRTVLLALAIPQEDLK